MRAAQIHLAYVAAVIAAASTVFPAVAFDRDRVHADGSGNLVIESAAGYKRILVGEGHEAGRLSDYVSGGAPGLTRGDDRVYADSFGNLVIESSAGHKSIKVGEGYRVRDMAEDRVAEAPEHYTPPRERVAAVRECYRAPYLVKGRSHMYGFSGGEIPFQGGPCR